MRDKLKLIIPLTFLIIFILFFCVSCRYSHCSNISSETTQANFTYLHKIAKPGTFKMSYKNFDGTENIGLNVRRGNRIKFKYKSR